MARKRKGRAVNGWVIIDKPAGMTSTAVVNKVKWAFDAQKAGHAGTLDPDATGILAVALGEATKTVPYITDDLKAYEFEVTWGIATNTDDADGEVIKTSDLRPSEYDIKERLSHYIGDILQIPPAYSAVKIDGQRAYTLARQGQEVDITARPLWVEELILNDCPSKDSAIFEMTCGKGGYVRSIARDLGQDLGCFGHVKWLRRLWSGPFDLDMATSLEGIETLAKKTEIDQFLHPSEMGLSEIAHGTCSPENAQRIKNGNPAMVLTTQAEYGDDMWVSCNGIPIAIGQFKAGQLHPKRILHLGNDP